MSKTDRARKMGVVAILSVVASAMCCFSYVYFELANHEIGSRVFWGIVLFPVIGFILGVFSIIIRVTWLGVIGLLLAITLSGMYLWVIANIEKGMKRQYQQSWNSERPTGTPVCGSRYTERTGLFSGIGMQLM